MRVVDNPNDVFIWLRAGDYKSFMAKNHPEVKLANDDAYTIIHTGQHRELYADKNFVQTSMIDGLYTLHKNYGNKNIKKHNSLYYEKTI